MRVLYLLLLISLTGCLDTDAPNSSTQLAEIDLLQIDPTGQAGEEISVRVRTRPYNGCWSNLEVVLSREDDRHILLRAFGTYEPAEMCTENLVREDTVIKFTPIRDGQYYFQANLQPFVLLRDTVEVD